MINYKIFGCKVNKFYLEKWLQYFKGKNLGDKDLLISSCSVTDKAKSKWLRLVNKTLKDGGNVYLTGCGSLDDGKLIFEEKFYNLHPELEKHKSKIHLIGESPEDKNDNEKITDGIFTKKFVLIQNGCDTNCTFCLTIKKRGASKSRNINDIINDINGFVDSGGKEIVLTGINLAAWGAKSTRKPETNRFDELLNEIITKTKIGRIRISSIGPEFLNDKIYKIFENPRFMPYFHISIQSFSNKILKSMNRNYDTELLSKTLDKLKNLNRKDRELISIGADIIIGFPGEEESNFLETLEGLKKFNITKLHAFPYSNHIKGESVVASTFKNQVPIHTIKEREGRLIKIGDELRSDFLKTNSEIEWEVLFEGNKGLTPNYIQVDLTSSHKKGDIVSMKIKNSPIE